MFSKDGRGLYVVTDKDSEFQRLAYFDLATKQITYLTAHIKWDVDEIELSPDGRLIAFVTNEDGVGRLRLLDTRTRKELPAPKLPVGIPGGLRWHENGRDLGFTFVSARTTADVYSLDARTLRLERWTESETGGINTAVLPEPELVRWPSFDGRQISGFLYRPPARFTGRRPVIVNIHGGPEGQSRPTFLGRSNYYLNEMGVAVVFPNVRGSSGYGKTFLQLDNGMKREDTYKDIAALLDWIGRGDLEADRVWSGRQYGGTGVAIATTTRKDSRPVPGVGISNVVTSPEHRGYGATCGGPSTRERDPRCAFSAPAPNNADKIRSRSMSRATTTRRAAQREQKMSEVRGNDPAVGSSWPKTRDASQDEEPGLQFTPRDVRRDTSGMKPPGRERKTTVRERKLGCGTREAGLRLQPHREAPLSVLSRRQQDPLCTVFDNQKSLASAAQLQI